MISSFKKVSKGNLRGWIREDLFNLLPSAFFENPISSIQKMDGEVIKESRLRWAAIFTLPNGKRVFFKKDRAKGWIKALKYFFLPSKARKEWFIAYQARKRNLPVPKPLGWMEMTHGGLVKENYYLSEAIGAGVSFIDDSAKLEDGGVLSNLAKALKKIHDGGLFHKDLHAGNFLWDMESFFLIDLHRSKIVKTISLNQRLWNLSQLFHSLRSKWGRREQIQFLEKYFEGESVSHQKKEMLLEKIHFFMGRLQKKQWKSRTKRCLKESTEFSIERGKGIHSYHRRDFTPKQLEKVIESHLHSIKEKPSALVKLSEEVIVSILENGKDKICVKQFRYPNFWNRFKEHFRHSKGLKAWIAANGLRARGILCLKPLALVERRNGWGLKESFFLMETRETDQEMDRYLLKRFGDFNEKRLFVKRFARWLSHFHQMDLYHKDMKACNIFVSGNRGDWDFRLLDLEDVLLDEKVDERKLFKNFLQLNTSIPKTITRTDRMRFFREYLVLNPIINNRMVFLRRLMEESRRRGVVYVSPQGVITETM